MKTLKTKVVNIVICWNNLKNIPPKDFPNIPEMEKLGVILEIMEEAIPFFVKLIKEGEELQDKINSGDIKGEDVMKTRGEWANRSRKMETEQKEKEITIEFENEDFNTFFQQFERWGKNWFANVKEFLDFRRNMTDANSAPKSKK